LSKTARDPLVRIAIVSLSSPRVTRQRNAVLAELDAAADFLSAQELHGRLREGGQTVGLSTVYRTLQALASAEDVDVIVTVDGEARYRSCSRGHHHHLVCRNCRRTVEVRNTSVESWAAQVAREHAFTEVSHTLEVFGLCPECTG
jgi:Fur family transcriptional regulator, ferric uptake regulator